MRIKITAGGIYDGEGKEIPIGTEFDVEDPKTNEDGSEVSPHPWAGRFEAIGGGKKGKKGVTNDGALKAEHHGGGKFNITQGEQVLLEGISKADADAFNALSDEDKQAFVASQAKA
jgi:hypothetical protein